MIRRMPRSMWEEALGTYDHAEGTIPQPIKKNKRFVVYDISDEDWIHLLQAAEAHSSANSHGVDPDECRALNRRATKLFRTELGKMGAKPW